jgi:hypothetical protein
MNITITIPDQFIDQMKQASGDDLGRRALELLCVEGSRKDILGSADLREILGFQDRWGVMDFVAREKAQPPMTDDEIRKELDTLDRWNASTRKP